MVAIALTNGGEALVDNEDMTLVAGFRWRGMHNGSTRYAVRMEKRAGKTVAVLMHREILQAPSDREVDHRDGNGLDNRKGNLRLCSRTENARNRTKHRRRSGHTGLRSCYKGVRYDPRRRTCDSKPWRAYITVDGRQKYLGRFADERSAARVYDQVAADNFGPFARLNFPQQVA